MSKDQLKILESEYLRESNWSLQKTKQIALRIDLDRVKVYKWHYDRKRRDAAELSCGTYGQYSSASHK